MVDLTLIHGDKGRPFIVSEIREDGDDGEECRVTELVICHRDVEMVSTPSGLVPTQRVVTPPFAVTDRAVAEAFCECLNAYNQFWDDFDWNAHDVSFPLPICPGASKQGAA